MVILKTIEEIELIRSSAQLVGKCLTMLKREATPGASTLDLDKLAEEFAHDHGAKPSFKGYMGFPNSICASINSEVIHGIPSNKPLRNGDVLSVDFGILLDGYHGDSALTFPIGEVSDETKRLIKTGQECLYKGISQVCEGNRLNQVSYAIQTHAETNGFNVIRDFVGHGIGRHLHEPPQVKNFTNNRDSGLDLKRGLVIAVEPMITSGAANLKKLKNGWTVVTADNTMSVHWEHTVAITGNGTEILSIREDENYA